MTKSYKRKQYLELNSSDAPRLDKRSKRSFEQSDRNLAKKHIKEELNELDNKEDDKYYELEMEMSQLCYSLSELDAMYKCACPSVFNEDSLLEHISLLKCELLKKKYPKIIIKG